MPNTYTQIGSTVTVGSGGVSTVSFNSIPSTYTDLKVIISSRADSYPTYTNQMFGRFNGSTSGYATRNLGIGNLFTPTSGSNPYGVTSAFYITEQPTPDLQSNTFSNTEINIFNYTGSQSKRFITESISENNSTASYTFQIHTGAGTWANSAAITSITFLAKYDFSGNFQQYSTFSLYGISNT